MRPSSHTAPPDRSEPEDDGEPSETPTLGPALNDQPSTLGAGLARERVRDALFGFTETALKIDRFTVLETIGRGGMGVVYAAWDPQLDRRVALKLVRSSFGADERNERVLTEARAMAKVPHPNVVTVFETGVFGEGDQAAVFVAMEFVQGKTLRAWAADGEHSWPRIVEVYRDAARGLAAIHRAGLVHGDFKPDNVMLDDDDHVRVMDFGLARPIVEIAEDLATTEPEMKPTGPVVGTPAYMAPELLRGQTPDAAADQFAFFVSLYEALWGERPWTGATRLELVHAILEADGPPRPPAGDVPAWVVECVTRGLSPFADERHPSLSAVVDALTERSGPRRTWLLPTAALAVLSGLSGLYVWNDTRQPACAQAADPVDETWNAAARARLSEALRGLGPDAAESTAQHTVALLDRYAEEQRAMRSEACVATKIEHTQSPSLLELRVRCLDRGVARLSSLVTALTEDPADTAIETAAVAAANLPSVSECSDVRALTSVVAPPSEPERREQLDRLWKRHAEAATLLATADFDRGIRVLAEAMDETTALDYPPLLAQMLLLQAELLRRQAQPEQALSVLENAAVAAARGSDDAALAEALSQMAMISSADLERSREAMGLRTAIEAALVRGGSTAGRARAAYAMALVHYDADQFEPAAASFQHAIELLEDTDDVLGLAAALTDFAMLRKDQDRLEEAATLQQRGLELRLGVVGELHPLIADSRNNLSIISRRSGDRDQAERELHAALAIFDATIGRDSPRTALTLMNLGIVLAQTDLPASRRWFEEALAIFERSGNPNSPNVADACSNLSTVLARQGDVDKAIEYLERARTIHVQLHGEDNRRVGSIDANLAGHLSWLGRSEEAVERYESARTVLRRTLGWEHPSVVMLHIPLSTAYLDTGRIAEAKEAAAFALTEREKDSRTSPMELADARFAMAKALWAADADQRPEAVALAQRARDVLADGHAGDVAQAELVSAWLADHPG